MPLENIRGLASAMAFRPVKLSKALSLINQSPNDVINSHHGLSTYIKDLRTVLRDSIEELMIRREESIFPSIYPHPFYFNYHQLPPSHWFFDKELIDYLFITITFDPRKFPQIIVATHQQQKQYIEESLALAINQAKITNFYGIYEAQKNGNIHFHFIINKYNCELNKHELKQFFRPLFTNYDNNKYCIDVRPVTDIKKLFEDYLSKAPLGIVHNLPNDLKSDLDLNYF